MAAASAPIRSETKATLIAAIAQGRRWLKELIEDPAATTERIATGAHAACASQHDNIAGFPCARSRQSRIDGICHTGWGSHACVICPSNGRGNTKPRLAAY